MRLKIYTCFRCVGKNPDFIKYGKTANGKQRYQCTGCRKTSVLEYSYNAYSADIDSKIILFTKEGLGYAPPRAYLEYPLPRCSIGS